jgi:cytochrome c-type biogenesis protein CcsB
MDKAGLASLSDTLFWVALAAYVVAMGLFFVQLAGRRVLVGRAALAVAGAGAASHLGSVLARGFAAGRVPWGNMYEYSSVMGLLLVAGFLILAVRRPSLRTTGGFAMAVAVVTLAAARGLYTPAGPLTVALNSWWLKVHVISAITASSIFSIGFVFTVLYLIAERAERRAAFTGSTVGAAFVPALEAETGMPADHIDSDELPDRGSTGRGIVARLPKAATLDTLAYRTISVAFPIWTWAVIAGAIWASKAWSRYWGWDPKETWAFITWVIYAAYLHARATRGVRGRGAALIAAGGFVSLWITYYVVNLWIVGLHSYAGVN